jgi:hypothetical protein
MHKRSIRVIKRKNIAASRGVPVANTENAAPIVRHEGIDLVKDWVAESRKNIRLEKASSGSKILGWKTILPSRN